MSNWYLKTETSEIGPYSFDDLVDLIVNLELAEDDRIRREGDSGWTTPDKVVGLLRAARLKRNQSLPPKSVKKSSEPLPRPIDESAEPEQPRASTRTTRNREGLLQRRPRGMFLGGVSIVIGLGILWWYFSNPTFPTARKVDATQTGDGVAHPLLPPRPAEPTIPGLEERVPSLLPGFEEITGVFSVSLTPDMLTIVYSGLNPANGTEDLYLAQRQSISASFPPPRLIASNSSNLLETQPAISPDGLTLLYLRHAEDSKLYCSRRSNTSIEFPEAEPLSLGELDASIGYLFSPQFIDSHRIKLNTVGKNDSDRKVIEFSLSNKGVAQVTSVEFYNPWHLYFVADDKFRAYSGGPEGLFLSRRITPHRPFGEPTELMPSEKCGEVLGTVWVSPQQDVIIYCSPGTGQSGWEKCRAWMMRY